MERVFIGIDPGKDGALAIIWPDGDTNVVHFSESDYPHWLLQAKGDTGNCVCCLEKVGARPGQGVTSMFNFGDNFGFIRGLLEAYQIPYQLVPPKKWKKEYSLGDDKGASIAVCKRLFPSVNLRRTEKCRADNDGMAEALLMAEYARRHM